MHEYLGSVCKVSSSVGSQTKSVNSAMHELDKDKSENCSVHTGLTLDSQYSSSSKTIAPPSVSVSRLLPTISIGYYCPAISIKNYCPAFKSTSISKYRCVGKTSNHS